MTKQRFSITPWAFIFCIGLGGTGLLGQSIPTLDPDFKPVITRAGGNVSALAVQPDGRVLVAGGFDAINGVARIGLARLNADSTVDSTYDVGSVCCGFARNTTEISGPVSAITLQPDGKAVIGGSFTSIAGTPRNGLARLNPNGTLDTTFDPGAGLTISASAAAPVVTILVQPDGKLLIGGSFSAINGVARHTVARLNADGSLDTTFNPGSGLPIQDPTDAGLLTAMALLSNGQILVAGVFQSFNAVLRNGLARLNADGSLDATFNPDLALESGPPSVDGLLVQSDGRIIISGSFDVSSNQLRSGLARLKADGTLDAGFDLSLDVANGESFTVRHFQPDGKIIGYHQYTDASNNAHRVIGRLNADGTLDPSLAVELYPGDGSRLALAGIELQGDGKLLIAGNLAADSNGGHSALFRVDASGALDAGFYPHFELGEGNAAVVATGAQSDGKVLIAGGFNRINGAERPGLARLNSDGSLDTGFTPQIESSDVASPVSTLLIQDDGKILIGGAFTSVNGTSRNGVARLNTDGTLDTAFDVGTGTGDTGGVTALAVQPDGKVLIAGDFSTVNGVVDPYLARLTSAGAVDLGFSAGFSSTCTTCTTPEIHSIGVLSNGVVMVGGLFNRVEAFTLNGLARLRPDGTADITLVPPIQAEEQVTAMVVGKDDKTTVAIVAADPAGTNYHARFLRVNPDASIDTAFNSGTVVGDGSASVPVSAMALDTDGRLFVAGQFTKVGDADERGLARFNPDGTLDSTFTGKSTFNSGVFAPAGNSGALVKSMALQQTGEIVVGGSFALVENQVRLGLARFKSDQPTGGGTGGGTGGKATLSGLARAADGTVSMKVSGSSGTAYRIDASSDLRTWTALGTVTGSGAPQPFSDLGAKGLSSRFYRAVGQ